MQAPADDKGRDEAPSDTFRPGQKVTLKNTRYPNKSGVVLARLMRGSKHEEIYFVESPKGAAMVVKREQMEFSGTIIMEPTVEPFRDEALRIVDCGKVVGLKPGIVACFVTPLERVTFGEYQPFTLALESTKPRPDIDAFDFENLRLSSEDDFKELQAADLAVGLSALVLQPGEPGPSWISDVLWYATVETIGPDVTVKYVDGSVAKTYNLEETVPKENVTCVAREKVAKPCK